MQVVGLGHMDFLTVEPEEKSAEGGPEEDDDVEQVVFLYKLVPGACPKSFGMNVARLADLPLELIRLAAQKSRAFEVCARARARARAHCLSCIFFVSVPLPLAAAQQRSLLNG